MTSIHEHPEDEEFDRAELPRRLSRVALTLSDAAAETMRLTALASEYAEALEVASEEYGVAEGRFSDLRREYDASQARLQDGQRILALTQERLAAAESNAAAVESQSFAIAARYREALKRAQAAEATALLLAEALCSTM